MKQLLAQELFMFLDANAKKPDTKQKIGGDIDIESKKDNQENFMIKFFKKNNKISNVDNTITKY